MVYSLLDFKHGVDFIDFGLLGLGEFANRQFVGALHGEFKKILNIYTTSVYINTETYFSTSKITYFFEENLMLTSVVIAWVVILLMFIIFINNATYCEWSIPNG